MGIRLGVKIPVPGIMVLEILFGSLVLAIIASLVLWTMAAKRRFLAKLRSLSAAAIKAVMDAYRRGDYEASLRASEGLRRGIEVTAPYCFFRGGNLAQLGRLEEAEVWLRRNIAMHAEDKEKRHLAIGLTTLGHLMLQAGRYEEAQECFEKSLGHFPERGSGYRRNGRRLRHFDHHELP